MKSRFTGEVVVVKVTVPDALTDSFLNTCRHFGLSRDAKCSSTHAMEEPRIDADTGGALGFRLVVIDLWINSYPSKQCIEPPLSPKITARAVPTLPQLLYSVPTEAKSHCQGSFARRWIHILSIQRLSYSKRCTE